MRSHAVPGLMLIVCAALIAACGDDTTPRTTADAGAADAVDAATDDVLDASSVDDADTGSADTGGDADVGTDADAVELDTEVDAPDVLPDADAGGDTDADPGIEVTADPNCEPLNPRMCILPFPTMRWLAPDADTATGYSLRLTTEAVPRPRSGAPFDVAPFERLDGVSPSTQIITLFDEPVDTAELAGFDTIERSLDPDHGTVILDLTTGERVPHWVEVDARAESPDETLFYLRPASRLAPGRAYGVALRGLRGTSGTDLASDEVFAALRDGVRTSSPEVEARRPTFELLFADLDDAGIARDELVAAWTFHTASDEAIRTRLLDLRDDAIDRLGDRGLGCTVTSVEDDFLGTGARRVRGTYTVPWYLDAPRPPARFVLDESGTPTWQGTEEVGFTAIVPASLLTSEQAGPLVTWGHGLFGSGDGAVSSTDVVATADAFGAVVVATDWHGMSSNDLGFLASALANVSNFYMLGQNLQQGMINFVTLTRSMLGDCRDLPALASSTGTPTIDPDTTWFVGGSQGSILGTTLLTISPDIDRGALIVGGANFSFMIERSIHFERFESLLTPFYGARLNTGVLMVLSQSIWDDAETAAWIGVTDSGSDRTDPKDYLYLIAENDAQVANLSSDIAARTGGIPVMAGSARLPWGVPVEDAPHEGSAWISLGTWDPPPAGGNVSPASDEGGHGRVAFTEPALQMIRHFFDTGEVIVPCAPDCGTVHVP